MPEAKSSELALWTAPGEGTLVLAAAGMLAEHPAAVVQFCRRVAAPRPAMPAKRA